MESASPAVLTGPESATEQDRTRWIYRPEMPLPDDEPLQQEILGSKGLSLRRLAAAGLPAPKWFTISTAACRWYQEHERTWPPGLLEQLGEVLKQFAADERFAVRSGAAGSMPGLMRTILDVPRDGLAEAITKVFDSWDAPPAQRYRQQHGWFTVDGTAVTVQAMFAAEVSGVLFSADPHAVGTSTMRIEAIEGAGTPLVGGDVTPCAWVIERGTAGTVVQRGDDLLQRPSMNRFVERGLPQLCEQAELIERQFGGPVDVEFGYAQEQVVYFQARRIAPPLRLSTEDVRRAEVQRLGHLARIGRRWWVRHNLSETLPAPTPLAWQLWRDFMSGDGGFGRIYRWLGYRPSRTVRREGFLELIGGRIYADPDRLPEMLCAGYPLMYDRGRPGAIDAPPTQFDLERLDQWFLLRWPLVVWTLSRAAWKRRGMIERAEQRFVDAVARLRTRVIEERAVNLERLSQDELLTLFERRRRWVFDEVAPESLLPGMLGTLVWSRVERRLCRVLGNAEGKVASDRLLSAVDDPPARRQHSMMDRFATGQASEDELLAELGHRGPDEMELSLPRWREQPAALMRTASRPRSHPMVGQPEFAVDAAAMLHEVVSDRDSRARLAGLVPEIERTRRLLSCRATGKDEFLRAYELLRDVLLAIGRRSGLGDGVFYLELEELQRSWTAASLRPLIEDRRTQRRAALSLHMPPVLEFDVDDICLHLIEENSASVSAATVQATPLSAGAGVGPVWTIDASSPDLAPAGSVLVAEAIPPGWMPFLTDAAAIIVERGGALSHVALLARQLGIPAVVCESARQLFQVGDMIQVDGTTGAIQPAATGDERNRPRD